ncbi:hypothetical protein ZWY2020_037800 [Hordeum vulgare]|nr:hypothetical protein ZWY2020_037800 [Hordeum vulgare]
MDGKSSSSLVPRYGEDEATGGAEVADELSSDQKWRSSSGRRQRTRSAGDVPHATAPTSSWSILVTVGVPRCLPSMLMRPWWQQLQERGKRSCSLFIHLELQVAPLRHLELHRDQDTHRGDLVRSLVIIWSITEDTAGSEIWEREGAASRMHVKRK